MFKVFARVDAFEKELASVKNKLFSAVEKVHTREEEIRGLRRELDNIKIALDALHKVAYPNGKK